MPINVVLYEPEIPQNTGNIMRTCTATDTKLHLIEPLGFSLDKKDVKRSAAAHLEGLNYQVYPNFETFKKSNPGQYYYITRYGQETYSKFDFSDSDEEIYFIFGKESKGIPYELLKDNFDSCLRIPMSEKARSLNLSNCVAIIIYEALSQQDFPGLSDVEVQKGADFLLK